MTKIAVVLLFVIVVGTLLYSVCVFPKLVVVDPLCEGLGMDNPLDVGIHTFKKLVAMPIELAMWLTGKGG